MTVTDHHPVTAFVPFVAERHDVRVDLGLQRCGEHPARSLQHDLVQHHPHLRTGIINN